MAAYAPLRHLLRLWSALVQGCHRCTLAVLLIGKCESLIPSKVFLTTPIINSSKRKFVLL